MSENVTNDPFLADQPGFVLKRCPFCGCNAPHKALRIGFPVQVLCPSCGALGPEKLTGREADVAWNVRAEVKS